MQLIVRSQHHVRSISSAGNDECHEGGQEGTGDETTQVHIFRVIHVLMEFCKGIDGKNVGGDLWWR